MEKFKEMYAPPKIRAMAKIIQKNHPEFPTEKFCKFILRELSDLEMKARVKLIASALREFLPKDYRRALGILLASIRSEKNSDGLAGFQAWPLTQFVEEYGLEEPRISLEALKELTSVMSAEFAIRPFLLQNPKETLRVMEAWALDKNVHVRRLASEGSRPRLPWGQRLPLFQKNPEMCLGILKQLRQDPELYVRKSVANHLNDFSKDHGDWLVRELAQWKKEFPDCPSIQWIIRHSCRSLVKAGHPGALALLGFRSAQVKNPRLTLSPLTVRMGGKLRIKIEASGTRKEAWLVDYAIHHRKNNGELKAKVFKWTKKNVLPRQKLILEKQHAFKQITTRKYYGGKHEVEVFVNGKSVAKSEFQLVLK